MNNEYNSILKYAKKHVKTVESLEVLEEQLNFSEVEKEMGVEIYLDDTLEKVVSYAVNESELDTLKKFKNHLTSVAHWKVRIFHALQDKKFVLVLS